MIRTLVTNLTSRAKRALDAFLDGDQLDARPDPVRWVPFRPHLVPNVMPALPPGCRFQREDCGWSVRGADDSILTVDLDPDVGAAIAWEIYNAFDHKDETA